ncbi:MAG: DUF4214 domain-containing protein [Azovibrio sp.]|uniref:DUF4214 domain-containing protein n=1 Tax=Azovibrio sp. TaxID=1872673 RepID=UPI003C756BB7
MAITVEMRTQVSQLYVALFGRAPDGEGLGYWVKELDSGKSIANVANAMYSTTPAQSLYPAYLTNAEIIDSFYTNVLGRPADTDPEGRAFWTSKLNDPDATPGSVIAEMIDTVANYNGSDYDGLTSADLFNNKVEVAQWYGETIGDLAGATTILANVTEDPTSIEAAKTGGVQSGETFTLTKAVDDYSLANSKATTGGDTYIAATDANVESNTLNTGDVIDGNDGADKLDLTIGVATTPTFTLKNVETIEVRNAGAGVIDMRNTDGAVKTLVEKQSTTNNTVNFIAAADVAVSIKDVTSASLISDYNWNTGALSGASDAASLTLNNVVGTSTGRHTVQLQGGTATQGFETVNVKTEGAASNLANLVVTGSTGATNTMTKLVVTGDKDLTIANTAFAATGGAIDASAFTGNLVVSAVNPVDVDFKGGKGNDTILFGADLQSTDKVDGGDGTDTLGANNFAALQAAFTAGRVSNVEAIRIENAIATVNGTLDVSKAGNVNSVSVNGIGANTNAINNLQDNATLTVTAAAAGGTLNANIKDATLAGTVNTMTLNLGSAADAATFNAGTIGAAGVETLNVASLGTVASGAGTNLVTITGNADLAKLVVTGSEDVTVTFAGGGAALKEFDASAATGVQNTGSIDFASSGATIKGGNKADVLTGDAGNDTLIGGAGNDQLSGAAGSDVLTGDEGGDTFFLTTNGNAANATNTIVDSITDFALGSGNDVIDLSQLANALRPVQNGNVSATTVKALNAALPTGGADGTAELIILDSSVADMRAADSQALNNKLFNLAGAPNQGQVLVAYSATDGGNVRLAVANITGGDITNVTDLAVLNGVTTASLASGFNGANLQGYQAVGGNFNITANTAVTGTAGNDTFTALDGTAFNNAVVNGNGGTDHIVVTNQVTGAITIGNGTTGGTLNGTFDTLTLTGGSNAAVTLANTLTNLNVIGTAASQVALGTGAGNSFNGANGVQDTVSFGAATQTATLDSTDNVLAAVAGAAVTTNHGNNTTINVTGLTGLTANFTDTSGAGDILALAALGAGTVTTGAISGFETLQLGRNTALQTITLGATTGLTTLTLDSTTASVTVNMSAAQLDALTTLTSAAAGNTVTIATTDAGAVTVNLADTQGNGGGALANVDSFTFASASSANVTMDENLAVTGTAGADILTVTGDINATINSTNFETYVVSVAQTGLTVANDATTVQASAGGTFVLGTGGDTFTGTGAVTYIVTGSTGVDTITTGSGNDTINLGQTGDSVTGGSGSDIFVVNDAGTTADVIRDFTAGAGGDVIRISEALTAVAGTSTLAAAVGTTATVAASLGVDGNDINVAVITDVGYASAATAIGALNTSTAIAETGGTVLVFFNTSTNRAEVYYEADLTVGGGVAPELLATLDNITTLTGVAQLVGTNFSVVA